MKWDEIARLFEELELRLIASLVRNLAGHQEWEKDEGFQWPAWQALKIQNTEHYRKQNQELMQRYRPVIDQATQEVLQEQFAEGRTQQPVTSANFFGVNHRRLDALIHETQSTEKRVERAALRMMDDVYRQTLHKAELAMAAGATTLPKAIDMAVQDFLKRGINCIEYKNGRRVNIADYTQMALRTAATRSYLQGEAQKRAELGVDTVLVSRYGACSKTCLPWQGRVYIDDVFGVFEGEVKGDRGRSKNGNWYPLLSVAVRAGLLHPNCRHSLTTWYEGISTMPDLLDAEKVRRHAELEAKQRGLERDIRKWKRLEAGTLEKSQKKIYSQKRTAAQKELRDFIAQHNDVLRRDYWREKTYDTPLEKRDENDILNAEESRAVTRYVGAESYGLNAKLRERLPLDESQKQWVRQLDKALFKLPEFEGTVQRSLVFDTKNDLERFAKAHKIGGVVTYPAYTSASVFDDYHDNPTIIQRIRSRHGRMLGTYNEKEGEVLFTRNSKFKVTGLHRENGVVTLDMEECEDVDV